MLTRGITEDTPSTVLQNISTYSARLVSRFVMKTGFLDFFFLIQLKIEASPPNLLSSKNSKMMQSFVRNHWNLIWMLGRLVLWTQMVEQRINSEVMYSCMYSYME